VPVHKLSHIDHLMLSPTEPANGAECRTLSRVAYSAGKSRVSVNVVRSW
jgi:hypothetical protein